MFLILGLGVSGQSVVRFLERKNLPFHTADDREQKEVSLDQIDCIVASPGIPPYHPLIVQAEEKGIEVISDIELGLREEKLPTLIGVTGTNGKTTTALLLQKMLQEGGREAEVVGNIGTPFLDLLPTKNTLIVELSSFQLMRTYTKKFAYGLILNITPDHLDYHGSFEAYKAAKMRLFDLAETVFFRESASNFEAAYMVAKEFSLTLQEAEYAYASFKKPPHRMQFLVEKEGISYVDDSKATNIAAVFAGVDATNGPVVLIACGVYKGESYQKWVEAFKDKVRYIIAFGESAPLIEKDIGDHIPVLRVDSMEEAIVQAKKVCPPGGTVLLSPGGSSFDMYKDYKARGLHFQQLVEKV